MVDDDFHGDLQMAMKKCLARLNEYSKSEQVLLDRIAHLQSELFEAQQALKLCTDLDQFTRLRKSQPACPVDDTPCRL